MALALVLVPLAFALGALLAPMERIRTLLIPIAAAIELGLVVQALLLPDVSAFNGWLVLDRLGKVFLLETSAVYFIASLYAPSYLALHPRRNNRVFCAALLAALGLMPLQVMAHHLGLMWLALETLTLTCAPLVYFNRNARSLEATWKYLLIGSVGIALALLGSLFLAYACLKSGLGSTLLFEDLVRDATQLSRPWLHAAFVLLFVGYGTKMGLVPMHTWKPDAYGEVPGIVGTLLACCVTSCAFLSILRFYSICSAAGELAFVREIMIAVGLLSVVIAGAFMTRQRDFKRMLAYSSIEHMGLLVLGVGIGGAAIFGALLHLLANGITKGALFLSAGNIHRAYGSKLTADVSGAIHRVPASGALFLAGFFAVTGSPPFAPFLSELTILREAFDSGQTAVAAVLLIALIVVFIGMGSTVLSVVQGPPPAKPALTRERFTTVAPVALFLSLSLVLGVYVPRPLETMLREAAVYLEARP